MEVLDLEPDAVVTGERGQLLEAATRLVYLTCLCSPRNAEELLRENGVRILCKLLFLVKAGVNPASKPKETGVLIVENIMHTLSGLATLSAGREGMFASPTFAADLVSTLECIQCQKTMH